MHLILVPQVLASDEYAQYYAERSKAGDTVILDNGVFEQGQSSSPEEILEASRLVRPTEIVLPDVLRDLSGTVDVAYSTFWELNQKAVFQGHPQWMFVPQGKSYTEWVACRDLMLDTSAGQSVSTIGIFEETEDWFEGSRLAMLTEESVFWNKNRHLKYHLLGMSEKDLRQDILNASLFSWVRSMDSGKCVAYGLAGIRLNPIVGDVRETYPGRPKDFFETEREAVEERLADIDWNIRLANKWAEGKVNV